VSPKAKGIAKNQHRLHSFFGVDTRAKSRLLPLKKQIDALVYELYGLMEEELPIVEGK